MLGGFHDMRNAGFTLVEAGIAIGVSAIAAAGIAASLLGVQKNARSVSLGAQIVQTQNQLSLALSSAEACTQILRNLPYPSGQAMKLSVAFPRTGRVLQARGSSDLSQGLKISDELRLLTLGAQSSGFQVDTIEFRLLRDLDVTAEQSQHLVTIRATGRKSLDTGASGRNDFQTEYWLKVQARGDQMLGCLSASAPGAHPISCTDLGGVANPAFTEGGVEARCVPQHLIIGSAASTAGLRSWLGSMYDPERPVTAPYRNGIFAEGVLASRSGVRAYLDQMTFEPEFLAHKTSQDATTDFPITRQGAQFQFFRGRKVSGGVIQPVISGDLIGRILASAQVRRTDDGGVIHSGAAAGIEILAQGASNQEWTTQSVPSAMRFFVTPEGQSFYEPTQPALEIRSDQSAQFSNGLTAKTLRLPGPNPESEIIQGGLLSATNELGDTRWRQLKAYESPVLFHTTTTTCYPEPTEGWVTNGNRVTVGATQVAIGGPQVTLDLSTHSGKQLIHCSLSRNRADLGAQGTGKGGGRCVVRREAGRWVLHALSWNGDSTRPHPYAATGAPEGSCVECAASCTYLE